MAKIKADKSLEHIGKKIAKYAKQEIISTIESGYTNDYHILNELEQYQETDWLAKLVYSLLINLEVGKVFDSYASFGGFKTQIKAKVVGTEPNQTSGKLSIEGVSEASHRTLTSIFYGGEIRANESGEGQALVFDAHTKYDKEGMQQAANQLRDYFRVRFENELENINEEIDGQLGANE